MGYNNEKFAILALLHFICAVYENFVEFLCVLRLIFFAQRKKFLAVAFVEQNILKLYGLHN